MFTNKSELHWKPSQGGFLLRFPFVCFQGKNQQDQKSRKADTNVYDCHDVCTSNNQFGWTDLRANHYARLSSKFITKSHWFVWIPFTSFESECFHILLSGRNKYHETNISYVKEYANNFQFFQCTSLSQSVLMCWLKSKPIYLWFQFNFNIWRHGLQCYSQGQFHILCFKWRSVDNARQQLSNFQ